MTYYDEQLRTLQVQVGQKRRLEAQHQELCQQREELRDYVAQLEEDLFREQADVERLEGGSLAAFFYNVVGKMDQRLDKEREEAYAAQVKFDGAARELSRMEEDIRRLESSLTALRGCEEKYQTALAEKSAAVKAAGGEGAGAILAAESRITYLEGQERELYEALVAGETALRTADEVMEELDDARGLGMVDLLTDGFVFDMMKYGRLDAAQRKIQTLQEQLRRFKTELADVSIQADLRVNVEGFLRFADYFFDGLFVDWAVLERIQNSKAQVEDTRNQMIAALNHLERLHVQVERERERTQTELEKEISKASVGE